MLERLSVIDEYESETLTALMDVTVAEAEAKGGGGGASAGLLAGIDNQHQQQQQPSSSSPSTSLPSSTSSLGRSHWNTVKLHHRTNMKMRLKNKSIATRAPPAKHSRLTFVQVSHCCCCY